MTKLLRSNALRNKYSILPDTDRFCFDTTSTDNYSPFVKMLPIRLAFEGSAASLDIPASQYLSAIAPGSPVLCSALQKHSLQTILLGASFISSESSLMFDFGMKRLLVYAVACEAITRQYVNYASISEKELQGLMIAIFVVVGIVVLLVLYLLFDCLLSQPSRRSSKYPLSDLAMCRSQAIQRSSSSRLRRSIRAKSTLQSKSTLSKNSKSHPRSIQRTCP